MIAGVGIDLIEVDRVEAKVRKGNGFKEKVFSPAEISYCESSANPAENYAVRFAAKEAFLKATGKGLVLGHDLSNIEVVSDEFGRPFLRLHDEFGLLGRDNNWKIQLSLSHVKSVACAVVIIEV